MDGDFSQNASPVFFAAGEIAPRGGQTGESGF
jgi:hypothetical protein